ncbi:MAG: hypothetical protein KJ887_06925 [Candidatus Omnitrophica bacterium]|nr:hypothetical protein [Candidatus Omnitrophota bacterium]MBU1047944.1 hypothetical protein [Candidatus Omnitrophota bacterium]MBU1630360.1 hypothetical protein [Candidatus Omnitrophota bacterium]MBU1767541.1 hypothetical protein [Candidatus Omnitrophota bacterium]MBU1889773.1 hypothetical protein [Candidatus Omnitrophota bacterium]
MKGGFVKFMILSFMLIFIMGCATVYKPSGLTGGYEDLKLQDDIYQVSFRGNSYISSEKVRNYSLLRASEIAIENGYKYFIILENQDYVKTSTYTTPVQTNTYGNVSSYGTTGSYTGTTHVSGGQTYIYHKPRSTITIKCYKEKPDVDGIVYDASQIKQNLSEKYKLK